MVAVREFVAKYSLQDNITQQLAGIKQAINSATLDRTVKINADTSSLSSKINDSGAAISKSIGGSAKVAEGAIKNAGKATEDITSGAKKAEGGFGNITKAAGNLQKTVTNIATSLAGIAAGGAVAGLSWLGSEQSKRYQDQVYQAIDANKRWKISSAEVKDYVAKVADVGFTSQSKMLQSVQAAYTYGGVYARGKAGLNIAQAAEKVAFNYAAPPGETGLSGDDLIRTLSRQGKLRTEQKNQIAIALGVSVDNRSLDTVYGRLKLLQDKAGKINIQTSMDEQPWKQAQLNIEDLKKSIGNSISGPMMTVTQKLADFIKMITKIPGGSALIGYLGIFIP